MVATQECKSAQTAPMGSVTFNNSLRCSGGVDGNARSLAGACILGLLAETANTPERWPQCPLLDPACLSPTRTVSRRRGRMWMGRVRRGFQRWWAAVGLEFAERRLIRVLHPPCLSLLFKARREQHQSSQAAGGCGSSNRASRWPDALRAWLVLGSRLRLDGVLENGGVSLAGGPLRLRLWAKVCFRL